MPNPFRSILSRIRPILRLFGLYWIRCNHPDDILVVRRYGTQEEWEYTLEKLASLVVNCKHSRKTSHLPDWHPDKFSGHQVIFADSIFVDRDHIFVYSSSKKLS